jgi:hypothetical protein
VKQKWYLERIAACLLVALSPSVALLMFERPSFVTQRSGP